QKGLTSLTQEGRNLDIVFFVHPCAEILLLGRRRTWLRGCYAVGIGFRCHGLWHGLRGLIDLRLGWTLPLLCRAGLLAERRLIHLPRHPALLETRRNDGHAHFVAHALVDLRTEDK